MMASPVFQKYQITLPNQITISYFDTAPEPERRNPVILMIHGLGNDASVWYKLIGQIQSHYRCIALDLPSHGDSIAPVQACGIANFADTIEALMRELQLEQVTLMGHSMGGLVAIKTVLNNPEAVHHCILLAPAGFETFTEKEKSWLKAIYAVWMLKKMSATRIVQQMKENFFHYPADFDFAIAALVAIRESEEAFEAYCQTLSVCMNSLLDEPVFDALSSIVVPCTVFFGIEDRIIPNKVLHPALTAIKVVENGCREIPNAELHLIPDCGHMLQWEAADQIAGFLLTSGAGY